MQDSQGRPTHDKHQDSTGSIQTDTKSDISRSPSPVAEISPRKIAVPVLVKDGKPCGDTSPLATPTDTPPEGIMSHPSHPPLGHGISTLSPLPDIKTQAQGMAMNHAVSQNGSLFGQPSAFSNSFGGLGGQFGPSMGYSGMTAGSNPAYYAMRSW